MSDIPIDSRNAPLPDVKFYRLLRTAPPPRRGARDAMGQLPIRASQYCEASAVASAFGWWFFPPMDFSLLWHEERMLWTWGGRTDWLKLDAAQYPGYAAEFDAAVPASLRGFSPPFLTALPEPGHVQVWTGFFARSAPGWSLLMRQPVNFAPPGDRLIAYEGIVESDIWFGPVFANFRFIQQDLPVHFNTSRPLLQLQPLPVLSYSEEAMKAMSLVSELEDFTTGDWDDYERTIVQGSQVRHDKVGSYAIAARRRRKSGCPASSSR